MFTLHSEFGVSGPHFIRPDGKDMRVAEGGLWGRGRGGGWRFIGL